MLVGMASSPTERTSGGRGKPTWQRALYELGRDFESLLTVVPACYLNAEDAAHLIEVPFESVVGHFLRMLEIVADSDGVSDKAEMTIINRFRDVWTTR